MKLCRLLTSGGAGCFALASYTTCAACSLWDVGGGFTVAQENGYAPVFNLIQNRNGAVTGSARYEHGPSGFVTNGQVAPGSNIVGSNFHVVIQWDNKTRGAYDGKFDNNGGLKGFTYDVDNSSSHANWSTKRHFFCLRP